VPEMNIHPVSEIALNHKYSPPTCRQAMDACQEACECKSCGNDVVGTCAAGEGDCLDCRDQRKCPVKNCPNFIEA